MNRRSGNGLRDELRRCLKASLSDALPGRDAGCDVAWEVAEDVYCLGPCGHFRTNVYCVHAAGAWVLVDAGWAGDAARIALAGATLCGADLRPASILLTHSHPDHSGAAASLARQWDCPVFMHPDELPIATGRVALNDRDVFEA